MRLRNHGTDKAEGFCDFNCAEREDRIYSKSKLPHKVDILNLNEKLNPYHTFTAARIYHLWYRISSRENLPSLPGQTKRNSEQTFQKTIRKRGKNFNILPLNQFFIIDIVRRVHTFSTPIPYKHFINSRMCKQELTYHRLRKQRTASFKLQFYFTDISES